MFFSIIINTHNQQNTIGRCLKSCIKQSFKKKYEIIVIDTSDKKIDKRFIKSKKIRYFHYKKFSKYPELNQLRKVYEGYKKAKGKWFCLMDGDDFYKTNKLQKIHNKYDLKQQKLLMDKHDIYYESKKKKYKHNLKVYKEKILYKNFINFWPEIYGTSSLSGNMKILGFFFKNLDLKKWNFLAIDALIILHCINKKQFFLNNEILTIKSLGNNNLGKKYKIFTKKYWKRRNQQIKYWEMISGYKIYNFDKLISKFVNFFI